MVHGLVLAAGGSRRMGQPKALLRVGGRPLVCAHLAALAAVCGGLRVVVGSRADEVRAALPAGVAAVENPRWDQTGMRESILLGLADLGASERVLITPVDVPPAPRGVLEALLAAGGAAVPAIDGQDGHPVLVTAGAAREILREGTLRDAVAGARRVAVEWGDGLQNLNTPEEWRGWLESREPPR